MFGRPLDQQAQQDSDRTVGAPRAHRTLRALDVALASMALPLLTLPAWLASAGRESKCLVGRDGLTLRTLQFHFNDTPIGRLATRWGASDWGLWLNVWRGDMAVVGPRPRGLDEASSPAQHLTPGMINLWSIRQRTAVDYGTEAEADREQASHASVSSQLGLLLRGLAVRWLPTRPSQAPRRVALVDVAFDNLDMREALHEVEALMASGGHHQVAFVNPACVNIAAKERGYRRILARSRLVLPDGIGIKLAGALLGTPLKQNLNGTDLVPALCEQLQETGRSLYLLGGQPGIAEAVAAKMMHRWPKLRIAGVQHGFFTADQEAQVVRDIRESGADCLLVALGVPLQEQFIDRHLPMLGVGVAMGVGGLFDFISGRIPRAPLWMRDVGLEWVWRLRQEPRRMWQRYLVGNLSFLSRVMAQRLGWRTPAQDLQPHKAAAPQDRPAVRALVLATQEADHRLPLPPAWPAALLPLGHQSVIEHLMARFAAAGVRNVDVVASEHVTALRAVLGDGARWGISIAWRLPAPDGDTRECIAAAARQTQDRLVVGPAHVLPAQSLLEHLVSENLSCFDLSEASGHTQPWRSTSPDSVLKGESAHAEESLIECVSSDTMTAVAGAEEWTRAQQAWLDQQGPELAPASWIRESWGVMSPSAKLHPSARVVGPVLIGPGCVIEADAELGPHTVLTGDVIVSAGSQVSGSTVMPATYIGPGLTLDRCIVQGEKLYHCTLDVATHVASRDASLLPLHSSGDSQGSVWGRALAAMLWLIALPALAAIAVWRWSRGGVMPWRRVPALCPRKNGGHAKPQLVDLILPRNAARTQDCFWAKLAALLDVALGHRHWFGARPRTVGQWHALPRMWQQALSPVPVGLIHVPAWAHDERHHTEAQAMADVYGANTSWARRLLRRELSFR